MRVRFRTNLGSVDARKYELDHTKCGKGEEIDVTDKVGAALCEFCADEVSSDKPSRLKAIPPKSDIEAK